MEYLGTCIAIALFGILYSTLLSLNHSLSEKTINRITAYQMTNLAQGAGMLVLNQSIPCTSTINMSLITGSGQDSLDVSSIFSNSTASTQTSKTYNVGCYQPDSNTYRIVVWTSGGTPLPVDQQYMLLNELGANSVGMFPSGQVVNGQTSTGTNLIGYNWIMTDFTPSGMSVGDVAVFRDETINTVKPIIAHQFDLLNRSTYVDTPQSIYIFTVPQNVTTLYFSGCAQGGGGGGAFTAQDSQGIMDGMGGLAGGHGQCTIDYSVTVNAGDVLSIGSNFIKSAASGGTSGGMDSVGNPQTITSGQAGSGILVTDVTANKPIFCLAGGFGGGTFTSSQIISGTPTWAYALLAPVTVTSPVDTTCQSTTGGVAPGINELVNSHQVSSTTAVQSSVTYNIIPKAELIPAMPENASGTAAINTSGYATPASVSAWAIYVPGQASPAHECNNATDATNPNDTSLPCHGNGGRGARLYLLPFAGTALHPTSTGPANQNLSLEDATGQSGSYGYLEIDW